jgi:Icc-related predicted phosphoesterase
MKFLLVSDMHSSVLAIETISRAVAKHSPDAVLVAGDLTMFGPASYVDEVALVGETPIMAVTGNCDTPDVAERMKNTGISICGEITSAGPLDIAGVPWTGRKRIFEGLQPDLLAKLKERDSSRPLIVLSHCPALGVLDEAKPGLHAGSQAISDLVASEIPIALLTGHVHEARGISRLGITVCVNAGPAMDGRAALVSYENGKLDVVLL